MDIPEPEHHEMDSFQLGNTLKIFTFFARFDDLIHGPEFSKEELYAAIVTFFLLNLRILKVLGT